MSYGTAKTVDVNGLQLHVIETDKYKTNTIVLHIKAPLQKDTVTRRAIIPFILQNGTETLPTRKDIRSHLDGLYGATLTVDVSKKGENQILSFWMDVVNENYVQDQTPLLEKAIHLLSDIILHPQKEAGAFLQDIVANEKRNMKQRLQSIFDDKLRYANMRVTEEMCKDENYGLSVWGTEEEIDELTPQTIFSQYSQMLQEDCFDLYVVGDISYDKITKIVKDYFLLPKRSKEKIKVADESGEPKQVKENVIFEEQDVKQGKLHIGFRTYTKYGENDYFALQMFNGIFGGFSHSKLFLNVREKASLAYYASSRFESHKGILMVMSGIEFANYEQVVLIIKQQLEAMRNGDFTEDEIEQTKAVIKNQLLETIDVPKGFVELLYHNEIGPNKLSIDEWLVGINTVTKAEIIAAAKKVQLDTIYFLKGKEEA